MERGSLFPVARIHWSPSTVTRERRDLLRSPPSPRPICPPPVNGLRWTPGHLGPVRHVPIASHTNEMYKDPFPLPTSEPRRSPQLRRGFVWWVWGVDFKLQRTTHGFLRVRSKAEMLEKACVAAICLIPVKPEVAGSSPVTPATIERAHVPIERFSPRLTTPQTEGRSAGSDPICAFI